MGTLRGRPDCLQITLLVAFQNCGQARCSTQKTLCKAASVSHLAGSPSPSPGQPPLSGYSFSFFFFFSLALPSRAARGRPRLPGRTAAPIPRVPRARGARRSGRAGPHHPAARSATVLCSPAQEAHELREALARHAAAAARLPRSSLSTAPPPPPPLYHSTPRCPRLTRWPRTNCGRMARGRRYCTREAFSLRKHKSDRRQISTVPDHVRSSPIRS